MTISLNEENYSLTIAGKTLLKDTVLSIADHHRYGLIGKNGSGKSTLLTDIKNRFPPTELYMVSQDVHSTEDTVYDTILSTHKDLWDMKRKLQHLETKMDTDDNDGDMSIVNDYQQTYELWSHKGYNKVENELKLILHHLGFDNNAADLPVNSFSGGWKMRISLASALFIKPPLLLLDEPTNHLDLEGNIWLANYLSEWSGVLVLVSHDTQLIDEVCTDIIHLYNSKLSYYKGGYTKFIKQFQQNQAKIDKDWKKYQTALKIFKGKGKGKTANQEFIKRNEVPKPVYERPTKINMPEISPINDSSILNISNMSFGYDTTRPLFHDVELGIDMDSRYIIVGRNGVGKSTLLKLMAGELVPTTGTVERNPKLRIGYFHQHATEVLHMDKTPVEYLLSKSKQLKQQDAHKWLGTIGLPRKVHQSKIQTLSGGQKARVALVEILMSGPHLLLLDEPTNHLDMETNRVLIEALNCYSGAVVAITHDMDFITSIDAQILHLNTENIEETDFESYQDYVISN